MVKRVGDEWAFRLRTGVAKRADGQWIVIAELDGQQYLGTVAYRTEAEAIAQKDVMRDQLLEVLDGKDVRLEHRAVNDEHGKRR
jgi:hypothetical protein